MTHERLNALAILNIHKELNSDINIDEICNAFILKNEIRRQTFYIEN